MKKRVCIVGAGPAGLCTAKKMLDEGIEVVIFEKEDFIGGQWVFLEEEDETRHTSCYRNLVSASTRRATEFVDYPMPEGPKVCHWKEILDYLHDYTTHFGLWNFIQFKKEVLRVEPTHDFTDTGKGEVDIDNIKWKVTVLDIEKNTKEEIIFDAVAVCNGHHWDPYYPPDIQGYKSFEGKLVHSHIYKDARICENKKVVVVGMGISGGDISQDIVQNTKNLAQMIRSTRRFSKFSNSSTRHKSLFSRTWGGIWNVGSLVTSPVLSLASLLLPSFVQTRIRSFRRYLEYNNYVSIEKEIVKPFVKTIHKNYVEFTDGTTSDVDVIVLCTGYKLTIPFLPEEILTKLNIRQDPVVVDAYQHVFIPEYPSLGFIGVLQVSGSLHPVAEKQAEWFAKCLSGKSSLPTLTEMRKHIEDWKEVEEKFIHRFDNPEQLMKKKNAIRPLMVNQSSYITLIDNLIHQKEQSTNK